MVILEKKTMPNHLQQMESLDTVVSLQAVLSDLQDMGEAPCLLNHI